MNADRNQGTRLSGEEWVGKALLACLVPLAVLSAFGIVLDELFGGRWFSIMWWIGVSLALLIACFFTVLSLVRLYREGRWP